MCSHSVIVASWESIAKFWHLNITCSNRARGPAPPPAGGAARRATPFAPAREYWGCAAKCWAGTPPNVPACTGREIPVSSAGAACAGGGTQIQLQLPGCCTAGPRVLLGAGRYALEFGGAVAGAVEPSHGARVHPLRLQKMLPHFPRAHGDGAERVGLWAMLCVGCC